MSPNAQTLDGQKRRIGTPSRPLVTLVVLLTMALASIGALTLVAPPVQATPGTDDYPANLRDAPKDTVVDPWQFYNRECTSFVAWRLNNDNKYAFRAGMADHWYGDASTWATAARANGVTVNQTPAVGAVAHWASGSFGHVAWVQKANSDGSIKVEEYNVGNPPNGRYNTRTLSTSGDWPDNFIHFKDLPTGKKPKFTASSVASTLMKGEPYKYKFKASGKPVPRFSIASGSLPPGLKLTTKGVLSGTPSKVGSYDFKVKAKNSAGSVNSPSQAVKVVDPAARRSSRSAVVSDGYMFVFSVGKDGRLYYRSRGESKNDWIDWKNLGRPAGTTLVGQPTAVVSDGYMFIHVVGADGKLYYRSRGESKNDWINWTDRGAPAATTLVGSPSAVVSDRYMFIHVVGKNGKWYYRSRGESKNDWIDWVDRGKPPATTLARVAP